MNPGPTAPIVTNDAERDFVAKNPNPVDRHVGSRVKMRRLMLRMTQGKLADAVGVTFQQVQKYEKGSNRIGASRLQRIAETLGVPPSYFFEGGPGGSALAGFAEEGAAYETEYLSTAEGLALNRAFARIRDPKVRRRVVGLVEAMADEDARAVDAPGGKRAAG